MERGERERCLLAGVLSEPSAPVGLLWSLSPYRGQPGLGTTAVSHSVLCPLSSGRRPRSPAPSGLGAPAEDAIVPSTLCTVSGKPRALPELIVSSLQKETKRMFINYLDPG